MFVKCRGVVMYATILESLLDMFDKWGDRNPR